MRRKPTIITLLMAVALCISIPVTRIEAGTVALADNSNTLGELDLKSPTGDRISLIPYIGRNVVVVVFWAAWCPICQAEVPRLNRLNSAPDVKVFGVNEGESTEIIKTFMSKYSIGYEVIIDPKASVAKSFGVPGMPYCVIIGKSGIIEYRGNGLPENLDSYIRK